MNQHIAAQRVAETVDYLTRRLSGLPIATVGTVTDLTFKWLRQEDPVVLETLGAPAIKALIEDECR